MGYVVALFSTNQSEGSKGRLSLGGGAGGSAPCRGLGRSPNLSYWLAHTMRWIQVTSLRSKL